MDRDSIYRRRPVRSDLESSTLGRRMTTRRERESESNIVMVLTPGDVKRAAAMRRTCLRMVLLTAVITEKVFEEIEGQRANRQRYARLWLSWSHDTVRRPSESGASPQRSLDMLAGTSAT